MWLSSFLVFRNHLSLEYRINRYKYSQHVRMYLHINENLQWEDWNNFFCSNVLFLTGPY
jgi:hypothetical protein